MSSEHLTYPERSLLAAAVDLYVDTLRKACREDQGTPDGAPGTVGYELQQAAAEARRKVTTSPAPLVREGVDALDHTISHALAQSEIQARRDAEETGAPAKRCPCGHGIHSMCNTVPGEAREGERERPKTVEVAPVVSADYLIHVRAVPNNGYGRFVELEIEGGEDNPHITLLDDEACAIANALAEAVGWTSQFDPLKHGDGAPEQDGGQFAPAPSKED